jgi:hypothetical protein
MTGSSSQISASEVLQIPLSAVLANIRVAKFPETDGNWDPSILKQLATIKVVFIQAQEIKKKKHAPDAYFSNTLPAENLVDEKSKKYGTHGTRWAHLPPQHNTMLMFP